MKRTNREKNSIIIGFIFSLSIFIISILYIIYYIIPPIFIIEENKKKTFDLQEKKKTIEKKGLSFKEFKSLAKKLDSKDSIYLKKLIEKTDETFYKNNFINNGSTKYYEFIKNKDINIKKSLDKSSLGIVKSINKILPIYSNNSLFTSNINNLTDYKFINYLENLFHIFNLDYKGNIGITSIVPYYKGAGDLDSSIYYIPLEFNLTGKKLDIINIIHYFENVGYFTLNKNKMLLHNDNFILNESGNKSLFLGDIKGSNIYNHQLADISYIKIPKYLDSSKKSSNIEKSKNLIDFLKQNKSQINEKISINIGLRFYVKGKQNYFIKESITKNLNNYKGLVLSISKKLKEPKLVKSKKSRDILLLNKLKKIYFSINSKSIKDNISLIRKRINKKGENLNLLYRETIKYDKTIDNFSTVMGEEIYTRPKNINKK